MLKKIVPLGLMFAALNAQADFVGVYGGASLWQPDITGSFESDSSSASSIDVEDDLGYSDSSTGSYYLAIEHPLPLLPNLRVERTNLSESSNSTLSRSIEFEDQTYNASSKINSRLNLSHTDWTGYYEILDGLGWLTADIGLTIRQFDGEIQIKDESGSADESLSLDVPVPLLYGKGEFEIPVVSFPLAVGGIINYLSVGGATIADRRFYVAAAVPLPIELGGEIGYRSFSMDFDDVDNLNADITASGWYASATLHF